MLVIPDLSKTDFTRVSLSAEWHEDPSVTELIMEKLARSIPSGEFKLRRGCKTFSKPTVLTFSITSPASVEIEIAADWEAKVEVEQGFARRQPIELLDANDFAAQVEDKLSVLYDGKLFGGSECHFKLDVDDLPPGGIVRRGIAAQARFDNDTLRLVGAQFAINDDNWHRLSWFIDPGAVGPEAWESIEGRVECVGVKAIGPTLLVDIVESAQRWVEHYILESSEVAAK